jgi:hypothetical protein
MKIHRNTGSRPSNLTGAALRRVLAADKRADEAYAALQLAADNCERLIVCQPEEINAQRFIDFRQAIDSYDAAKKAISKLVPRHQQWHFENDGFSYLSGLDSLEPCPEKRFSVSSERYKKQLTNAGVILPSSMGEQFWIDLVAMGA